MANQQYVEFYFPGLNAAGQNERKVESRDASILENIPEHATSFRFFEKDASDCKVNFSECHYLGTEYSNKEFKSKFPQHASDEDLANASRIVKIRNSCGFYTLREKDIVVAI